MVRQFTAQKFITRCLVALRAVTLRLLVLIISLTTVSCANLPEPIPESVSERLQNYPFAVQNCAFQLVDFKRTVQQQGVQDVQHLWVPRYPHLAFDRFSLSLIPELTSPQSKEQWLHYVARLASVQREVEHQNLANKAGFDIEHNDKCARQLTTIALNDRQFWHQLRQYPPHIQSNYQNWQRVLGLYPISKLLATPAIDTEKKRIISGFISPLDKNTITYAATAASPLHPQEIQSWFTHTSQQSHLGWPLLSEYQIARLSAHYSPEFLIESASLDDKPGLVAYHSGGQPYVNTSKPTLYTSHSYTRFHGQILLQLEYSLWFANRTATSTLDPYAGQFDGLLVRLTLDSRGRPYILDSIHHCGCYHMVFALDPQLKFAKRNTRIEAPITMHINPRSDAATLQVTVSKGDHMVKSLRWVENSALPRQLNVLGYQQLRSLPLKKSRHKSLFDEQGMLMASTRLERWYLWPFGVKSPGTMRQVGHHAIAFIGERHFDDADMLSPLFQKP
ncbi:hypothetical protein [Photobacterium sp. OFAV2-7]|uniref:hypothetical protein n=1 Tax=Photobacterium sp. OFAV2-7 TaxID=2917748 RepID=UPI001EF6E935|nr:hypothetical protein [Photobacterium sp. OFAV2-7]MCG7585463.1 hypothetical protein [Photobacterium sp. OFAV2-7]